LIPIISLKFYMWKFFMGDSNETFRIISDGKVDIFDITDVVMNTDPRRVKTTKNGLIYSATFKSTGKPLTLDQIESVANDNCNFDFLHFHMIRHGQKERGVVDGDVDIRNRDYYKGWNEDFGITSFGELDKTV